MPEPGVYPQTPSSCPRCGYTFTAAGTFTGAEGAPQDGDVSICLACGAPLRLRLGGQPEWLTYEEVRALPLALFRDIIRAIVLAVTGRHSDFGVIFSRRRPDA